MKKVILAFDSFKGSVSALEINASLTQTIQQIWPECDVCSFPIADGGEGTVQAIEHCCQVTRYTCKVHDPLMNPILASYVVTAEGVAIIEMAAASGLPLVPPALRNPLKTSTLGTGELIVDALNRGCKKFVIGLGGSSTNDAGLGVMYALGARFLDKTGASLSPCGKNLERIVRIDRSQLRIDLADAEFILACDVKNPFYGPQGAAYVFAPQKGATAEQIKVLDNGLRAFAVCLKDETGIDVSQIEGAGAAGGMGGGLFALLNAELKSGIDIILDLTGFVNSLNGADLVLTGEGKIDAQTGMGKALNGVLKRAQSAGVPVIGIGGAIENVEPLNQLGFTALFSIQSGPIALQEAMQKEVALRHINETAIQILRVFDRT